MLKPRVITASILLICFVPLLLYSSPLIFGGVLSAIIALAAWEWGRLIFGPSSLLAIYYSLLIFAAMIFVLVITSDGGLLPLQMTAIMTMIMCASVVFWLLIVPVILRQQLTFSTARFRYGLALAGALTLVSDGFALSLLRERSIWVMLSVLMIVWVADIGAYFTGKQFGKHKLALQISPGKSIEGVVGGMVCVVLLCLGFYYGNTSQNDFFSLLGQHFTLWIVIIVSIFLAALSVLGDLFESQLKRLQGMKDSSGLLPGHGGVLDRLDALLPVLPVTALLVLGMA